MIQELLDIRACLAGMRADVDCLLLARSIDAYQLDSHAGSAEGSQDDGHKAEYGGALALEQGRGYMGSNHSGKAPQGAAFAA